jgi:uncharacterized protein
VERAVHLSEIHVPMLLLQGTRDELADLGLLRPIADGLPRATLHVVEDADYFFHVRRKQTGRGDLDVIHELPRIFATWAEECA